MADRPPDACAARAINTLAAAGLHCVVLSDTASTTPRRREALAAEGLGWMELYLSSETGYEKPHPAALRRVLADYALAPYELLMVGDLPERDVAVAQAVGSPAVLVDTHPAAQGHAQRAQRMGADVIADVAALPAYLGIPPL